MSHFPTVWISAQVHGEVRESWGSWLCTDAFLSRETHHSGLLSCRQWKRRQNSLSSYSGRIHHQLVLLTKSTNSMDAPLQLFVTAAEGEEKKFQALEGTNVSTLRKKTVYWCPNLLGGRRESFLHHFFPLSLCSFLFSLLLLTHHILFFTSYLWPPSPSTHPHTHTDKDTNSMCVFV